MGPSLGGETFKLLIVPVLCLGMLVGCSRDPYAGLANPSTSEVARVAVLDARLRELLGVPPSGPDPLDLDSVGLSIMEMLPRDATIDERVGALTEWFAGSSGVRPILRPEDADLVPSLARERGRGGCTALAWMWMRTAWAMGVDLQPVLLPGHVALMRPDGRFLEPLRHGLERSAAFYDSAFSLKARPGYSLASTNPDGISAALAVHCGLLEWTSGNADRAAAAFELALSLAPGLPEAEGNLGLVLEERGGIEVATAHLRAAVLGDPFNTKAADRLARLLDRRGGRGR